MDHENCDHLRQVVALSAAPSGMRSVWNLGGKIVYQPVVSIVAIREICNNSDDFLDDEFRSLTIEGAEIIYEVGDTPQHLGYSIPGDGLGEEHWRRIARDNLTEIEAKAVKPPGHMR